MFKNNLKNMPTHQYLEYDCDAGVTNINLGLKEVTHIFSDFSIGNGTYGISVNHQYSTNLHETITGMGQNWKLNIQQYVYAYQSSYNLGLEEGDYIYIDGENNIHRFEQYETFNYFEKGTGLTLSTSYGSFQISDDKDNSLSFDANGRLIEITSKGRKQYIRKRIEYNGNGLPEKYYDTRNIGNKERYIKFEYNSGILNKMSIITKGKVEETIQYNYENEKLRGYYRFVNKTLAGYAMFKYDNSNNLDFVIGQTGQALKLSYGVNEINVEKGISKVILNTNDSLSENAYLEVNAEEPVLGMENERENYVNDNVRLGEEIRLFKQIKDDTLLIERFNTLGNITTQGHENITISYTPYYTQIVKSDGKRYRYYINSDKEILSMFEVENNNLLTLTKDNGYQLQREMDKSDTSVSINRKKIISVPMNKGYYCVSQNGLGTHEEFIDNKYKEYYVTSQEKGTSYVVTFFVKHKSNNSNYVKAVVKASNRFGEVSNSINIDPKGINAWQYVEVPFSFNGRQENIEDGIYDLLVKLESDVIENYEITNVRLRMNGFRVISIGNPYIEIKDIPQCYQIRLETASGRKYIKLQGADYITHSDLYTTLVNKSRDYHNVGFDFIYCNNKKRYANVKEIYITLNHQETIEYKIDSFQSLEIFDYDYKYKELSSTMIKFKKELIETHQYTDEGENITIQDIQGRMIYSKSSLGKAKVNEYDLYGNLLSTMVAEDKAFDSNYNFKQYDASGKANKRFYLINIYDDESGNGEYRENIIGVKNEELYVETIYNAQKLNEILEIKSGDNVKEEYQYDTIKRLKNITLGDMHHHIGYNNKGQVVQVTGSSNTYQYEYDEYGSVNLVSILDNNQQQKLFETKMEIDLNLNQVVKEKNYLTNVNKEIYYDSNNRLTKININEEDESKEIVFTYQSQNDKISTDTYTNYMDESSSLANVKQLYDGYTKMTTQFEYDRMNVKKGFTTREQYGNIHLSIQKDNMGQTTYNVGGTITKTNKAYGGDVKKFANLSSEDQVIPKFTYAYEYDNVTGAIKKRSGSNSRVEYSYEQTDNSSYYSMGVQKLTQTFGNNNLVSTFKYDQNMNLNNIYHEGMLTNRISYFYDDVNRIKKESHSIYSMEYYYNYNRFNRLSTVLENGTPIKTFNYDELGRITSYNENGQLQGRYSYSMNNLNPSSIFHQGVEKSCKFTRDGLLSNYGNITYKYDVSGIRISKTTGGQTTKYYYQGNKLLGENLANGEKLRYMYDGKEIVGVRHHKNNGTILEYEYVKDNTGNVIAVVMDNTVVAKYFYDAWGNVYLKYEDANDGFAKINPIRYKSYYYDIETGYYYLESRYYDPKIGAFISSDNPNYLDVSTVGGLNLYCYCLNNPVMFSDSSGHFPILIVLGILFGASIGFGTVTYMDYQDDGHIFNGSIGWGTYLGGTLIGGAVGGLIGYAMPAITSFMGSSFTFGGGMAMTASGQMMMAGGITITGAQVIGAAGILGSVVMMSKSDPWKNTSPKSWLTKNDAIDAMKKFGGDADKAATYLMDKIFGKGNWSKGAKTDFNAIRKWLDRIIRGFLGM